MSNFWKIFLIALTVIGLFIFLAGCGVQTLNYQGKERPTSEIEEMLADYLESENPNYDLNVTISLDSD